MRRGHVVDQFLNEHRFADAGPAEEADLTPFHIRGQQVDDLDAGLKDLGAAAAGGIGRSGTVDRLPPPVLRPCSAAVKRFSECAPHPPEDPLAHRDGQGGAGGEYLHIPAQPFGGSEQDATHDTPTRVSRNLHHTAFISDKNIERLPDGGKRPAVKQHIRHRPADTDDAADARRGTIRFVLHGFPPLPARGAGRPAPVPRL